METVKESSEQVPLLVGPYLGYIKWRKLVMALAIMFMVTFYAVSIVHKGKESARRLINLMMLFLIIDRAVNLGYIVQLFIDVTQDSVSNTKNNRDGLTFMIVCNVIFLLFLLYGVLK